ncbi:MAG: thiamine-phosphate synthase family protein [Methanomicrobiales archaeon]
MLQGVLIIQTDEKAAILQKLSYAASLLPGKISDDLIPSGGVQLAYARKVARDDTDIASVKGGLGREKKVLNTDDVGFGSGGMIATVLLTAMKFDPVIRSAAIIACTSEAVKMMESRYLEICSFDPLKEPPGIRTMDWGVAQCCRDGVPDAVYNRRTGDTGAIIRLFGEDPLEVANNILMLSV